MRSENNTTWKELVELCERLQCVAMTDELLSKHTTFRIGGACRVWVEINAVSSLQAVVNFCREKALPYTVLGNGSNILASDTGYDGAVFHLGNSFAKITLPDETTLQCESGVTLAKIGKFALQYALTGMECLAGIPGTVGGALYMNAGAYGKEMKDIVLSARILRESGIVETIPKTEMDLGYRSSIFRKNRDIILEVTLSLEHGNPAKIQAEMDGFLRLRREKQPLEFPSAGSTFQRPAGNYASALIDQCGCKGLRVGDAMVSQKHAGFVVNVGKATCSDVLALCRQVQEIVAQKTGYHLELEPEILGTNEYGTES